MTSTQVVLQSEGSEHGPEGHAKILTDLRNLAQAINANQPGKQQPASYGGGQTAQPPVAGIAKIFCTPNASISANSLNFYTIQATINGVAKAGVKVITSVQGITAYNQLYLGSAQVSPGSMVETSVVATGSPSTTLTSANFSVRTDLSPGATS